MAYSLKGNCKVSYSTFMSRNVILENETTWEPCPPLMLWLQRQGDPFKSDLERPPCLLITT